MACGKPCRTQTEKDLHIKRTGHVEFENKASYATLAGYARKLRACPTTVQKLWSMSSFAALQTAEASAINTEAEMQQASAAMQEALKGNSAASAALTDMDVDTAKQQEMASV